MKGFYYLLILAVLSISPAVANPDNTAVALLAQQLSSMESLTAQFNQQIKDNRGALLQEASGTLSVKRPRRFHWRTELPYEHLVVTDGTTLWLYDIDLDQISKQAFSADLDKAPALLLSGEIEQISSQYKVELLEQSQHKLGFKLTPLVAGSLFKTLTISFSDQQLSAMSLHDSFDQITNIKFSQVKLNTELDDQLFKFVPPPGIDVIDNES